VIPLNETAIAAMEAHAAWYARRFGECWPEWFVFALGTPLPQRSDAPHHVVQDGVDQGLPEGRGEGPVAR
jgi:hypothetical protein